MTGRHLNKGPEYRRWDFSTFKNIPITERFMIQFRAEFFNIVNHPNFNAPDSAATALWRFRTPPTSTTLTSAQLDLPAMLPTLRDRFSLL